MRKIVSLLMMLMLLTVSAFSQSRVITGRVTGEDNQPVSGATVNVRGTTTSVSADANGDFRINARTGDVLVITATNYGTREVSVGDGNSVSISLARESALIEEVVVTTALGINRTKRSIGYSTQTVSATELNKIRPSDISQALAGKVSGLQVLGTPSSNFGEGNVRIRGAASLTGGNPIYVVDGTVVNLNAVNLDDVESLTVLKGPSATAIYGVRGAGGVVLITTKKGRTGKATVSFNTLTEVGKISLLPDYQNEYGGGYSQDWETFSFNPAIHPAAWAAFQGQKLVEYGADESWGPKMDGTLVREWFSWYPGADFGKETPFSPHPNSVKDFYDNSVRLNNNLVFDGGNENAVYRFSYNNRYTTLPFPNTSRKEHIISLKGALNVSPKFRVSSNLNYLNINQMGDRTEGYTNDGQNISQNFNQWWQRQVDINKLKDYKNPAGGYKTWNIRAPHDLRPAYWDNIYYQIYESFRRTWQNRTYGDVTASYDVFKGFKANVTFRANVLNYGGDGRIASGGLELDRYNVNNGQTGEYNQEFLLEYKKDFGDFGWEQFVGGNMRQDFRRDNSATTVGGLAVAGLYSITASKDRPAVGNSWSDYKINSLYARGTFNFRNFVFLDYSVRNDWSSALPEDENSYLYPSAALSFVFTDLLGSSRVKDIISYGKLRAAYGRVGTDLDPYQLNAAYGLGTPYGSNPTMGVPTTVYDPNIRASLSREYEFGTELQFLNNRIGADFSIYKKDGVDQILPLSTTPSSGSSSVFINAGLIRSSGWDLILNGRPVSTRDFRIDLQVNLSRNKSEVIDLDTARNIRNYSLGTGAFGPSVNSRVGQRWGTYVGRKTRIDAKTGLPVINASGAIQWDASQILGSTLPDYTGGALMTFSYKDFSLSSTFSFQDGGQLFSTSKMFLLYSGLHESTIGLNDKGKPVRDPVASGGGVRVDGALNGTPTTVYVDAQTFYARNQAIQSEFMLDASYVKMTEARVSYSLPVGKWTKTVKSASLSLFARNPWLISAKTKTWGIDPSEIENANGFYEGGQLPPVRSFGVNLSVVF